MLKELNRIAAGLLGLHGYPVEPWPAPAKDVGSRQRATTAPRRRKTTLSPEATK